MSDRRVGLWLIGAFGGVGSTTALGLAALARNLIPPTGLVTALPGPSAADLDPFDAFVVGGHDIRQASFGRAATELHARSAVFPLQVLAGSEDLLSDWSSNVRPGVVFRANPAIASLADRPDVHHAPTPEAAVEQIQSDLRAFESDHRLDQVAVVNVASTEPPFDLVAEHQSLAALQRALAKTEPPVLPTSGVYAYAALDAGYPYVNLTPSRGATIPALEELARERGVPHAGQDAKTGETLLKSVLAPMFAKRHLRVLSWVGHNILGNRDGLVLSDPQNKVSKVRTKDALLAELLGYRPQSHVSIEYIESLDDWKTAWDHIHFEGFLGTKMTLQFTWQGCDSVLAAPLVIDLARLVLLAQRRGEAGVVRELACFFKSPIGVPEHDFGKQFDMLENYLANPETRMRLAFSTNAYLNYSFAEAARRLAEIGYAGLELMADVPHAWPAYLLPEQKQAILDALAKYRLAVSNVNAFMMHAVNDPRQKYWHPSWIEPDRHYRQIRIDHTKRALTLAKEIGAKCITTEPGGPVEGRKWSDCLSLFVEMLKPVVEHAEKEGVMLLVEPEPDLLIETADQYLEFAAKIQSPMLGLNFDIGHFYCVKDEPAPTVHKLKEHIRHVHLEDIAATRVHHHLIPGEGVIDFGSTLKALKDVGYSGWVTIELYTCHENPDYAARTARERVVQIAKGVGVGM